MAVRRQRDRAFRLEHDLPLEGYGWHAALPEKMNAPAIQSEIFVVGEERLGGGMIRVTRHDEPVERPPVARPGRANFLGENLEERFSFQRCDGERSLRPVVTEPSALPARDGEAGDASAAQRILTERL